MTNPLDPSTFDQVAFITIPSSYTWHKMTVPLSSYTGDGNYIAIRVNGSYNNVYIDDFTITKEESCAYAFDLYDSRLIATVAKINWYSTRGISLIARAQ